MSPGATVFIVINRIERQTGATESKRNPHIINSRTGIIGKGHQIGAAVCPQVSAMFLPLAAWITKTIMGIGA